MLAVLVLLGSSASTGPDLLESLRVLGALEGKKYRVVRQTQGPTGSRWTVLNEDGRVLVASTWGLDVLTASGSLKHLPTPPIPGQFNLMYVRLSPNGRSAVVGDGEYAAMSLVQGRWRGFKQVSAGYFLPGGLLAITPSFDGEIEAPPRVRFQKRPMGTLQIGGWSFTIDGKGSDETQIGVVPPGVADFLIQSPPGWQPDWPGLYFSPTGQGGVVSHVAGRTPDFWTSKLFDRKSGKPIGPPVGYQTGPAWSASSQAIVIPGGSLWLVRLRDGKKVNWRSPWTPIWDATRDRTVLYRERGHRLELAICRAESPMSRSWKARNQASTRGGNKGKSRRAE